MNLTFRNLSLVLSFVLLSTVALAQGDRFNNEKIEAAKVTFFTQKLDLSADQAKVFWPIYNDFDYKQRDLNVEKKYYNKLKASLPIKTVGKFYRAQEAFKRELLNQFRGGGPRREE